MSVHGPTELYRVPSVIFHPPMAVVPGSMNRRLDRLSCPSLYQRLNFPFCSLFSIQLDQLGCRCRRFAQPALRSPKLETYMCLCVHSLYTTVDSCGHHEAAIGLRWPRSCVRTLSDSRMQHI